jgi:hypothetical protein
MPATIVQIEATDTVGDSRAVINDNFAALKTLAESSEAEMAGKAPTAHGHAVTDIANLLTLLAAKADVLHGHEIADIVGLATELAGKAAAAHSHAISFEELTNELLADSKGKFPATVTTNGSGDPTQIVETGLTSANKKRRTNFTYDGSSNVATVEVRLLSSVDAFLYGFRKTYSYTGGNLTDIAVEPLIS